MSLDYQKTTVKTTVDEGVGVQRLLRTAFGCSTVVLVCFTCPAITVATVILKMSSFVGVHKKESVYLPAATFLAAFCF